MPIYKGAQYDIGIFRAGSIARKKRKESYFMTKKINLAVIGLGNRGCWVIENVLLKMPDVHVAAVCDVYEDRVAAMIKNTAGAEDGAAQGFTDYRQALSLPGLDGALVFSSWETHGEISMFAIAQGIPVGSDVGSEFSLTGCQRLVDTFERTKTPYMLLENCCYGREELLATAMARAGLFGQIVHCAGSYSHDLRQEVAWGIENRHYRFKNYQHRCCENYPTHELGPIAKLLNINRGNRIVSVSSMASKAAGLKEYIRQQAQEKAVPEYMKETDFAQGDIVTTMLKCAGGETILLRLDTTLPRFYSRDFTVRGTKGMYEQATNSVFIEGTHSEKYFEPVRSYQELINNAVEYEADYLPPIWKDISAEAQAAGHGGMDYFVFRAFADAIKKKTDMPIDVYDAAVWMAVSVLSEQSIQTGGAPQAMPDFTQGAWQSRKPADVTEL